MQRKYTFLGLLTLLLFISISLSAQMSDQQVIQELRKYENSGMSQQEILTELTKKGISASQLQRIRTEFEAGRNNIENGMGSNYDPSTKVVRDTSFVSILNLTTPQLPRFEQVYGQDFFSSDNLTFAPNLNMPTPANYVLGPGDEVIIDMWGNSELNVRYTITPDGYIIIPGLGRIMLSGLNVQQAESKIRTQFSTIYSDLDSPTPGTFLGISVGNIRTIKVNVMGEVVAPGTYTLSSFASAFHALYASGGTTNIGSLRNIRIFRDGRNIATVDLYEYLMNGNNTGDINLHDGDIVMIEPYSILAQITGEVKRPKWYELRENETLQDLIRFAGGLNGNAYRENILLNRKGVREMEAFTLYESEYDNFRLQDGDKVEVSSISDKFSNIAEISGSIERPGKYAIGENVKTVRELVEIALGPTNDAYLQRALLYRELDDQRQTMESFDLDALLHNRIPDIPLRKNDRLHIPSIFNIEDSVTIYVGGSVRNPNNYPFAFNMRIEDALLQAGGLKEEASIARIDVYRRIKNSASTTTPHILSETFSFTLQEGEIISSDPSFVLQPFDQIVVRRSPGYNPQKIITINGEVIFGGQYAKERQDERLSDLVKRAGGLTEYAYLKGARLSRKLTPDEIERSRVALMTQARIESDSSFVENIDLSMQYVGIDLEKALKKPGSDDDVILMEGDVLTIPLFNNTVKISGGVMYPNTVTYQKNMSLSGYIRQAGGYSRLAMKNKPFVIYANGKVATGRWAKIEPGCEIVLPEKPEREPMSLQGILGISTSLASIALLISNLVK